MLTLIDRYILKQILQTLFFVLIALCTIFIVVNFMENMDKFMDSKVSTLIIVKYYIVYLPEILKILTPVSVLVSCLFAVGKLSNNNEITAMKSGGLGLNRLIFPISVVGLLLSVGQYFFNGWVVPEANMRKENISRVYLNRSRSSRPINNLAFRDTPFRNVLLQYYDPIAAQGHNVIIEDYTDTIQSANPFPKLVHKIEARRIVWNDTSQNWTLHQATIRKIITIDKVETKHETNMEIELNINHKQMEQINKRAEEMTFTELAAYLTVLQNGGKDISKLQVDYYSAQALPLANFIVIMFAVSFASVKRRGGLAVQITAAMIIAFVYLLFFEIMKPIGTSMALPPVLVGWFANILFATGGLICIYKTRS